MIFMEGENMVISINDASEIPIYQQIRNQIVLGISDGRLAPGEQLPTVRQEFETNKELSEKSRELLRQIISEAKVSGMTQTEFFDLCKHIYKG